MTVIQGRTWIGIQGGSIHSTNPLRGGLVSKAHRLLYHSIQGLRAIKKRKKKQSLTRTLPAATSAFAVYKKIKFNPRRQGGAWIGIQGQSIHTTIPLREGLVCKAHRLLYHSILVLRLIKRKKELLTRSPRRQGGTWTALRGGYGLLEP